MSSRTGSTTTAPFRCDGNLRDWWKPADDQAFQKRAECLIHEYSSFETAPGLHGNGELTLEENIADNGGMRIAYMTLERLLDQSPGSRQKKDPAGLTAEQRFFLAYGRSGCQNQRDEAARHRTLTNEHSLPRWRVNGTVQKHARNSSRLSDATWTSDGARAACRVWLSMKPIAFVFAAMIFLATAEVATQSIRFGPAHHRAQTVPGGCHLHALDEFGLAFTS